MIRTPRQFAIAALWATALWPLGLFAVHPFSPLGSVMLAEGAAFCLWRLGLAILLLAVLMAVLWPPFLPASGQRFRRWRHRLRQDPARLQRALTEIQHLDTAAARVEVARLLQDAGRCREAATHLQRALELAPELVSARYLLGRTQRELGDARGAADSLRQVVREDPDHGFGAAALELGLCEADAAEATGDADLLAAALATLQQHQQQYGQSRCTWLALARVQRRLGDRDATRAALRAAAAPAVPGEALPAAEALCRARARAALWTWGRTL